MIWIKKYKPKTVREVVGQDKGIRQIEKWIRGWGPGKKAALLYGPPGNGKTAVAYALANDLNYELIELNASDFRREEDIKRVLGHASEQASLFKRGKLILIDEVDGISGKSDRGGVRAVINVIKKSKFPIILTANDPWKPNLRSLRNYCRLINFGRIGKVAIKKRLRQICEKEGIKIDESLISELSDRSGGDLRVAINNLQSIAEGRKEIKREHLEALGFREQEEDVFQILKVIFKTHSSRTAFEILGRSDKSTDELFWWIEQNIPQEYEKIEEIAKAYDWLSRADIYLQRIRKRQHWRFKLYANELMSSGVAVSKKKMYHKFTRYYPANRLVMYGRSKSVRVLRDKIAEKIARECHTSKKQVREVFLPYIKFMFRKDERWATKISKSLGLSPEEIEFLS